MQRGFKAEKEKGVQKMGKRRNDGCLSLAFWAQFRWALRIESEREKEKELTAEESVDNEDRKRELFLWKGNKMKSRAACIDSPTDRGV